ncbi:MAG: PQQ-binding-like beta-propeller repeat protein [Verrucomicrobiae bacterium]|nr:PQQ-binding-like beta-propeller repeat protein [Verrucomicrobiae bacterium]
MRHAASLRSHPRSGASRRTAFLTLALLACTATVLPAADWPQYHGPLGDGSSLESVRTDWEEQPPRILWRRPIGPGWSSIAAQHGRIVTQERRATPSGEREFCLALDAATGDPLWAVDVERARYTDLAGYDDRIDGPRSTPTLDGDRVYLITSHLKLLALHAGTGDIAWIRDFPQELGSSVLPWENAASPLLVGDLILLNANAPGRRLMAVRKHDGSTAWSGQEVGLTHATPVLAHLDGVAQAIFLTLPGLVSVVPETGAVLWRLEFSPSHTSTAASPVVAGNHVHASAAYAAGTWIGQISRTDSGFTAVETARQRGNAYQLHWSTPVAHEGFIYAIPSPTSAQARLACLDPSAGTNRWTQTQVGSGNIGFGSLIRAANSLIVLTESGELVLVPPNPQGYSELGRFKILHAHCWNRPALANGVLFARNSSLQSEIVAVDLSTAPPPLPPLRLATELPRNGGGVRLKVASLDGAPINPAWAGRLEVLSTPELPGPPQPWPTVFAPLQPEGDALVTELPADLGPIRFFRVQDREGRP